MGEHLHNIVLRGEISKWDMRNKIVFVRLSHSKTGATLHIKGKKYVEVYDGLVDIIVKFDHDGIKRIKVDCYLRTTTSVKNWLNGGAGEPKVMKVDKMYQIVKV